MVAGLFAVRLVLGLLWPLSPQEAYYWDYSRHPAWSYFDHPPLSAWSIALFTSVFGNTVLAVRLVAFLYSAGSFWVLFVLVRRLGGVSTKEFLPLLFSPFFFLGGMQMLPDSPLLFFYALALLFGWRAGGEGEEKSWYGFGVSGGLALLAKYSAVLIFAGLGLYILLSRSWKILKSLHFWTSLVLAGLIFSPVIFWNAQNHWSSFLFQSTRRAEELSGFSLFNFGRYLVTQVFIVSPVLWLVNWRALWVGLRAGWREDDRPALFLAAWAVPFFLIFSLVAFFYWVKLNWLWPGYLAAAALALHLAARQKMMLWSKASTVVAGVITCLCVLLLSYQPLEVNWSGNSLVGWKELAKKVEQMKESRGGDWLVAGYEYKAASELAFYLPGQPETYSNTLLGEPGLQYDYWFDEKKVLGKNFIFVVDERNRLQDAPGVLGRHFARVEPPESLAVWCGRGHVTTFHLYRCRGYQGS